jgi:hypothetical protein
MSLISLSPVSTQSAAEPRRWKVPVALACLQFMLISDATVVNVALRSIKADLGFSHSNLAWVVDAYVLVVGGVPSPGRPVGRLVRPPPPHVLGRGSRLRC